MQKFVAEVLAWTKYPVKMSVYIYFLYRGLSTYVGLIIRKLRDGNGFGNKPLQKSNH